MTHAGIKKVLFTLALLIASPQGLAPAHAQVDQAQPPHRTTPSEVHREVQAIADGIEAIRFYMGATKTDQAPVDIKNAAPHEVIYLAGTLFEKTNRLSYELIREVENDPQRPTGDITPDDVMAIVRSANKVVTKIVKHHDLVVIPTPPHQDPSITPTDVFKLVVQLNRQINILLEKKYRPEDTYEELSLAIAFAARIRSQWPGERIPQPTDVQPGKRPADVYRRLLTYHHMVRQIAHRSGLHVLEVTVNEKGIEAATSSDVHDIAALLSADLAHIDRNLVGPWTPRPRRHPGRKVPSDVYQRAGILGAQLHQILEREALASPSASERVGQ